MDRIAELLAKISTCTDEEIAELESLIDAEYDSVEAAIKDAGKATPELAGNLDKLVQAAETASSEKAARGEAEAEANRQAEELRSRMKAVRGQGKPEANGEAEAGTEGEPGAGTGAGADAGAPEAIAASAGRPAGASPAAMNAARGNGANRRPEGVLDLPGRSVLVASAELPGFGIGQEIPDRMQLAEAIIRRLHGLGAGGRALVASARTEYPDDRKLRRGDAAYNASILDNVAGLGALTASGGICAPVNVDYEVPTWATADRPIRAGLAAFQANRGGVSFVTPPDIGALASATAVWTEATDANPGSSTKPVLVVNCGNEVTTYVNAIPTRLQFGNMQGRFAPEQIAANTDLAIAAAARIAENELLSLIASNSTVTTTAALLGAARDFLATLDRACAAYRYRHRIPRSVMLTAIMPDWFKDMLRSDFVRELAHDNAGSRDVLAVSDAQIESLLNARGVHPIWHLDGQAAFTQSGVTTQNQTFASQTAGGSLNAFPSDVVWYLFCEGTFQFLDAGELNLGVVRDSLLDGTNDYETFVETFEGIAYRGIESLALVSSFCANGESAASVSTSSFCS